MKITVEIDLDLDTTLPIDQLPNPAKIIQAVIDHTSRTAGLRPLAARIKQGMASYNLA